MSLSTPVTSFTVEQLAIDQLRPDPANPRRISGAEPSLTRSLSEWGFVQPGSPGARTECGRRLLVGPIFVRVFGALLSHSFGHALPAEPGSLTYYKRLAAEAEAAPGGTQRGP